MVNAKNGDHKSVMGALLSRPSDWDFPKTYEEAVQYSNKLAKYRKLTPDAQFLKLVPSERLAFLLDMQWQHEMIRLQRIDKLRRDSCMRGNYASVALNKHSCRFANLY